MRLQRIVQRGGRLATRQQQGLQLGFTERIGALHQRGVFLHGCGALIGDLQAVVGPASSYHGASNFRLKLTLLELDFLVRNGHCGNCPGATRVTGAPWNGNADHDSGDALAAASLNLIMGYGGMMSFGHAAYLGIGGYAVGILYRTFANDALFLGFIPGTDQLLITLPAAILVAGLFACIIGALSLRTSGVQFIMITLAFAQMLFFLFVALKAYGGDDGLIVRRRNVLFNLNMADDTTFYYLTVAIAVIYFIGFARLVRSPFGMLLGGIRQKLSHQK